MKDYKIQNFPKSRVATFDVGKISRRKHEIIGLVEVNITRAKELIKEQIKRGSDISLYSWIIKTIARSIADNPSIQAIHYRKNSQVVFNSVDISLPLEKTVDGQRVPLAMLLRDVEKRSIADIKAEIDAAVQKEISSEKDFVLAERNTNWLNNLFFSSPQWLRMLVWRFLLGSPFRVKKNMGTAIVTNIGISGNSAGWIIPKTMHNLCIGIGTVSKKPVVVKDRIEVGHILHLTIIFNHDAVDGVPAAKFVNRLVRNLESAQLLE